MTTIFIQFCRFFYMTSHQNPLIPQAPPQMTYTLILIFGIHKRPNCPNNWHFFTQKWPFWPKNGHQLFFFKSLKTTIKIKLRALGIRSLSFLVHFLQPSHLYASKFFKMSLSVSKIVIFFFKLTKTQKK